MPPLTPHQILQLKSKYSKLRLAIVGDFSLDRYLEIDASKSEISIETNKEVFNVTRVRSQPGAAGTILNNLVALGIGQLFPVGFCGDDGEGFELLRALRKTPGVCMDHFIQSQDRATFTYTKPLMMRESDIPEELNRLDFKNWTTTPDQITDQVIKSIQMLAPKVDGIMILDQVDIRNTGVITDHFLAEAGPIFQSHPNLPVIADSRKGLSNYPPVIFKMNLDELKRLIDIGDSSPEQLATTLAAKNNQPVYITMSELGILGATPDGAVEQDPIYPVRGPLDIVGAGDSVSANLIAAHAATLPLKAALQLANTAATNEVHKVGTTGVATLDEIANLSANR